MAARLAALLVVLSLLAAACDSGDESSQDGSEPQQAVGAGSECARQPAVPPPVLDHTHIAPMQNLMSAELLIRAEAIAFEPGGLDTLHERSGTVLDKYSMDVIEVLHTTDKRAQNFARAVPESGDRLVAESREVEPCLPDLNVDQIESGTELLVALSFVPPHRRQAYTTSWSLGWVAATTEDGDLRWLDLEYADRYRDELVFARDAYLPDLTLEQLAVLWVIEPSDGRINSSYFHAKRHGTWQPNTDVGPFDDYGL